jgi:hypothetical protein
MERTYCAANLILFYDKPSDETPVLAVLELEHRESSDRGDHIIGNWRMKVSVDDPLVSDPRWKEVEGRDDIEERGKDEKEAPRYWLRYRVGDVEDPKSSDWVLAVFKAAEARGIPN